MPEFIFFHALRKFILQILPEEHGRRRIPAEKVNQKEIVIILSQIALEPGNLAGGSGKEDKPPLFEIRLYLPENLSGIGLQILALLKPIELRLRFNPDVFDRIIILPGRAIDDAALGKSESAEFPEYSAGGTAPQKLFIRRDKFITPGMRGIRVFQCPPRNFHSLSESLIHYSCAFQSSHLSNPPIFQTFSNLTLDKSSKICGRFAAN